MDSRRHRSGGTLSKFEGDWRSSTRKAMSENPSFRPAIPWVWVIWAVRNYLKLDLAWRNRLGAIGLATDGRFP